MLQCTTGQLQERQKGGKYYYWIRLNLVDDTAQTRKERYKDKYIPTNLLVGGKTGRIKTNTLQTNNSHKPSGTILLLEPI